jgi:hypothetical protein
MEQKTQMLESLLKDFAPAPRCSEHATIVLEGLKTEQLFLKEYYFAQYQKAKQDFVTQFVFFAKLFIACRAELKGPLEKRYAKDLATYERYKELDKNLPQENKYGYPEPVKEELSACVFGTNKKVYWYYPKDLEKAIIALREASKMAVEMEGAGIKPLVINEGPAKEDNPETIDIIKRELEPCKQRFVTTSDYDKAVNSLTAFFTGKKVNVKTKVNVAYKSLTVISSSLKMINRICRQAPPSYEFVKFSAEVFSCYEGEVITEANWKGSNTYNRITKK